MNLCMEDWRRLRDGLDIRTAMIPAVEQAGASQVVEQAGASQVVEQAGATQGTGKKARLAGSAA